MAGSEVIKETAKTLAELDMSSAMEFLKSTFVTISQYAKDGIDLGLYAIQLHSIISLVLHFLVFVVSVFLTYVLYKRITKAYIRMRKEARRNRRVSYYDETVSGYVTYLIHLSVLVVCCVVDLGSFLCLVSVDKWLGALYPQAYIAYSIVQKIF